MKISEEELINELKRLARNHSCPPTLQELREHGKYSATTYYNRFGSWKEALAEAGFSPRDPQTEASEEELIQSLVDLADRLEETPTVDQMDEEGDYWTSTYRNHFGSWDVALEKAGLERTEDKISKEELISELKRLGEELSSQPSREQMSNLGKYSESTYRRQFGSWTAALQAAGFDERPSVGGSRIPDDKLLSDLQDLAEKLDKKPTMDDMNEHGPHSPNTYVQRFGSWSAAIEIALNQEDYE
ncbi:homing endonuclease associated repeat-containing protein [Halarchaeum grantii]|uniref:homing endonuclease associated repeat-containing protein n=1 Tax=Halarchaeum grantii TaxID=1193105 RepID=UPI00166B2887|nr:hypothetical protein [Halarchaeum grantii]